ncbi:DNA polymerase mu [Mycena crocata]|nr:DNA polymerase mu [Mycena crocata]
MKTCFAAYSERPTKRRRMSDEESDSASPPPSSPASGLVKIYLVQAKLSAQDISELFSLAERHNLRVSSAKSHDDTKLEWCSAAADCDIIVTNVRMRQRLERHISGDIAKDRAIVTPSWLRDSVARRAILPCGDYAALGELQESTTQNCPDSGGEDCGDDLSAPESSRPPSPIERMRAHYTSRYACLRPCPLVCTNQGLVRELGVIRRSRELEGKDTSALAYERAISVLKAYPHTLTASRLAEVSQLPAIGPKMLSKIQEYINSGRVGESQTIAASTRFQSLSDFTTVYGIGATTARTLFDAYGLRTIADLEAHYAAHPPRHKVQHDSDQMHTHAPPLNITAALALRREFEERIPRAEVEAMRDVVMAELEALCPGCTSTIVGGYRRGKADSNDVDIVITHPTLGRGGSGVKGLGETLVDRLYECGRITHVMHLSSFRAPDALRTAHWDALEKALTVFILPPDASGAPRVHRRLDLIFAAPDAYWTAVVGWTGSKMFERDLRHYAKVERGLKFDSSGLTRRRDSKAYFPRSEQEVFDILGLEWLDPTMRNADS